MPVITRPLTTHHCPCPNCQLPVAFPGHEDSRDRHCRRTGGGGVRPPSVLGVGVARADAGPGRGHVFPVRPGPLVAARKRRAAGDGRPASTAPVPWATRREIVARRESWLV